MAPACPYVSVSVCVCSCVCVRVGVRSCVCVQVRLSLTGSCVYCLKSRPSVVSTECGMLAVNR